MSIVWRLSKIGVHPKLSKKPVEIWYDPSEDQLYELLGGKLRCITYSELGAFKDKTGSSFYLGGLFANKKNPAKYGLVMVGLLNG